MNIVSENTKDTEQHPIIVKLFQLTPVYNTKCDVNITYTVK